LIQTKDGGMYCRNWTSTIPTKLQSLDNQEETDDPDGVYKEPVFILPDNSSNVQNQSSQYQTRSGRNVLEHYVIILS